MGRCHSKVKVANAIVRRVSVFKAIGHLQSCEHHGAASGSVIPMIDDQFAMELGRTLNALIR